MKTFRVSSMRKNVVVGLALAVILAASALVFAYNMCFFANGVSVSFRNTKGDGIVHFQNQSDVDANVPHIIYFQDGSQAGPINTYVPARQSKTDLYPRQHIRNVEQCW